MGSGQGFFHSHRSQGKEGSGAVLVSIGDETRSGLKRGGGVLTLRTPLTTLQSWLLGGLMPKVLGGSSTVMKRLFLIVTVFFGISLWSRGDVLITEILASNFEIEADEFGGQSDWLELYNSSVQSVNLKGWILGTARVPEKGWHLPERVLSGGEVVRVWCSGKDQVTPSGEMHADFRLSAKGEVLRLWRPGTAEPEAVFDYRSFPQYADISFGFSHPYEALDLLSAESRARYRVIQDGTLPKDWIGPCGPIPMRSGWGGPPTRGAGSGGGHSTGGSC